MKKTNTKAVAMVGMAAAMLAVISQISLPMPSGVPVTLQTFGVALIGFVLGAKCAAMAVGAYILAGAVGIPVFSGFGAGPGVLLGKTGGFLWGFFFLAGFCGAGRKRKKKWMAALMSALGLVICHLLGSAQFELLSKIGFIESALAVSLPYALKDAVSVFAAFAASKALERSFRAAGIRVYGR